MLLVPFKVLIPMKKLFLDYHLEVQVPYLLMLHPGALDTPHPYKEVGPRTFAVKYKC